MWSAQVWHTIRERVIHKRHFMMCFSQSRKSLSHTQSDPHPEFLLKAAQVFWEKHTHTHREREREQDSCKWWTTAQTVLCILYVCVCVVVCCVGYYTILTLLQLNERPFTSLSSSHDLHLNHYGHADRNTAARDLMISLQIWSIFTFNKSCVKITITK